MESLQRLKRHDGETPIRKFGEIYHRLILPDFSNVTHTCHTYFQSLSNQSCLKTHLCY